MFTAAVPAPVLTLLKSLSPHLAGTSWYLAGGTALALQLGHRVSIDLDFFTAEPLQVDHLIQVLSQIGAEIRVRELETIHAWVGETKCSFFRYPYRMIEPMVRYADVWLASIADIASMKVVAIAQRGTKKDFFDVYEILRRTPPKQVKAWFLEKYGEKQVNCYHVLRSFFYFDEAEAEPDPVSLHGATWNTVKAFFRDNEKSLFQDLICNEVPEDSSGRFMPYSSARTPPGESDR